MRSRIVDAAFEAFTRDGYNATSIQDLRAATGLSGGAFAHHFPTKKALCLAVIRDRVAVAIRTTWIEPIRNAPDTLSGVKRVFESVLSEVERNGTVSGCPLGNLSVELSRQDGEIRVELDAIYDAWRNAIAQKLAEDIKDRRLARVDPERFAFLVVAIFSGGIAMAKTSQSASPLRQCWRQLQDLWPSRPNRG
jgi:AcrR family transcriptional regulator